MNVDPIVESAGPGDLVVIRALLEQAALPASDLAGSGRLRFWVVRRGGTLVGAVGLEQHGSAGLLRSLVVAPTERGYGLAGALVRTLEDEARASGIGRLVLLTQTAAEFFAKRGYAIIERAKAPASVRESTEFTSLCPASAVCMLKVLP